MNELIPFMDLHLELKIVSTTCTSVNIRNFKKNSITFKISIANLIMKVKNMGLCQNWRSPLFFITC